MKKFIVICAVATLILVCARFIYINKVETQIDYIKSFGTVDVDNVINKKFDDVNARGVGTELLLAIEDEFDWEKLPLTEHFKKKYKNGKAIMPERDMYSTIHIGYKMDNEGKEQIELFCDNKPEFFDFFDENPKTTIYYYDYKISSDNKLDDIVLVKKEVTDSTTGNVIAKE